MNKKITTARRAATAALAIGLSTIAAHADASVTTSGCAGGSFGAACGLDELLAGGSITVGGYSFTNFALSLNDGRLPTASAIRIDALDAASAPGLSFVDTATTLRSVTGGLTSSNLSFDIVGTAGARMIVGASLSASIGALTGTGSYTNLFGDVFNTGLTTFLGNLTDFCDGAACANGSSTSSTSFAGVNALSLIGGVDVSAGSPGTAQVNSFAVTVRPTAVPEPETYALVVAGSMGLALSRRRRRPTTN